MSLYVHLFHGFRGGPADRVEAQRKHKDWGPEERKLGPFDSVNMTYLTELRCYAGDEELLVKFSDGLLLYDGCTFGDVEVREEEE